MSTAKKHTRRAAGLHQGGGSASNAGGPATAPGGSARSPGKKDAQRTSAGAGSDKTAEIRPGHKTHG